MSHHRRPWLPLSMFVGICGSHSWAQENPPPLAPDVTGINKCRFLSFEIPPENATFGPTALRINFTTLQYVVPPYTGGPTISWNLFFGRAAFAGPPSEFMESSISSISFHASIAQCTPHYQDWSTVGLLHVTGTHIVPSSIYHVEQVAATCEGREDDFHCLPGGGEVSSQLEIRTSRWGDLTTPFNPPSASVQPDTNDVSALVNKFRNDPAAPPKVQAILAGLPGNSWGEITADLLSEDFGFSHISACVDAYRGVPYVYRMGKCAGAPTPPRTGACITNSECGGNNGAGPCNLYCP